MTACSTAHHIGTVLLLRICLNLADESVESLVRPCRRCFLPRCHSLLRWHSMCPTVVWRSYLSGATAANLENASSTQHWSWHCGDLMHKLSIIYKCQSNIKGARMKLRSTVLSCLILFQFVSHHLSFAASKELDLWNKSLRSLRTHGYTSQVSLLLPVQSTRITPLEPGFWMDHTTWHCSFVKWQMVWEWFIHVTVVIVQFLLIFLNP